MESELQYYLSVNDEYSRELKKFQNEVDKTSGRIGKFGESSKKSFMAIAKYSAVATAALGAVGVGAVKMARDFNKSMANVSTLIDTNVESMEDMKKEILEMSKSSSKPLAELSSSLYDIRSAGISAEKTMETLESASDLAVGGLGSTKEATDLLTSSLNAFETQGYQSDQIANILFKTVKNGKTTVAELSQGFGGLSGLASELEVDFSELMAATSALTTSGLPASQAYTSLKAVLSNIIKPSKQATDMAEELGFAFDEQTLKSKGLVGMLNDVREATGGNVEVMAQMFGSVEGLNSVLALTGSLGDTYEGILANMKDGTDELTEAVEKQNAEFTAQYQMLKNKFFAQMIQIGQGLIPYVIEAMGRMGAKIEEVSKIFEGNGIGDEFIKIKDTIHNIWNGFLFPVFEEIKRIVKEVFTENKEAIMEFGALTKETFVEVGKVLLSLKDPALELIEVLVKKAVPLIIEGAEMVMTVINGLASAWNDDFLFMKTAVEGATKGISSAIEVVGEVIDTVLGGILEFVKFFIDSIKTSFEVGLALITGDWESAWNLMGDFTERNVERITGLITGVIDKAKSAFSVLGDLAEVMSGGADFDELEEANKYLPKARQHKSIEELHESGIKGKRLKGGLGTSGSANMVQEASEFLKKQKQVKKILDQTKIDSKEVFHDIVKEESAKKTERLVKNHTKKVKDEYAEMAKGIEKTLSSMENKSEQELKKLVDNHEKASQKIKETIEKARESINDLSKSYEKSKEGVNKSIAEKVIEQEEKIKRLREEGKTEELKKEENALAKFMDGQVGLEEEMAEARRRLGLTEFERFMEDKLSEKEQIEERYELEKSLLEEQIQMKEDAWKREQAIFQERKKEIQEMQIQQMQIRDFSQSDMGLAKSMIEELQGSGIKGKRAKGGPVMSGSAYLVGEEGPEIFTPSDSGMILNNQDTNRILGENLRNKIQKDIQSNNAKYGKNRVRSPQANIGGQQVSMDSGRIFSQEDDKKLKDLEGLYRQTLSLYSAQVDFGGYYLGTMEEHAKTRNEISAMGMDTGFALNDKGLDLTHSAVKGGTVEDIEKLVSGMGSLSGGAGNYFKDFKNLIQKKQKQDELDQYLQKQGFSDSYEYEAKKQQEEQRRQEEQSRISSLPYYYFGDKGNSQEMTTAQRANNPITTPTREQGSRQITLNVMNNTFSSKDQEAVMIERLKTELSRELQRESLS